MGSVELAGDGAVHIRFSHNFMAMLQLHTFTIILLVTTMSVSSLYLLDPNTGRPVAVNNRFWTWRQPELIQKNSVDDPIEPVSVVSPSVIVGKSDYVSDTGTPLYKLRQRNP